MRKPLQVNSELVARLDGAEAAFFADIGGSKSKSANNNACTLLKKPGVLALIAPGVSDPLLNRIIISGKCDEEDVGEILDCHFANGAPPSIEISPGALDHELSSALFKRGYSQTEFLPVLVDYAENVLAEEPKLRVVRVDSPSELQTFKELLIAGWTVPPAEFPATLTAFVEKWIDLPGVTLFVAYDGDNAVSCGILHCFDNIGFLAVSATPPSCRGRGGQSAIDRARIQAARQANMELLWSRTYFGSVSQRNKEKLGLNSVYTRACWERIGN